MSYQKSYRLSSYYLFIVLLIVISNDLFSSKLILSSALSKLLLKLCVVFFSSAIAFFSSRISVWFCFSVSFSLLNFQCCSNIVSLIMSNCTSVFSCRSLNLHKMIILNYLLDNS